jgi:hypothetical protein
MFNYVLREGRLLLQAKTGLNTSLLVWSALALAASFTLFAFLCVALYYWLALQLGTIFGALASAGVFLLLALIFVVCASASRSGTKKRAKLERAKRAAATPARFFDPQLLKTGLQAGRAIGWQRLIALVLLGASTAAIMRRRTRPEEAEFSAIEH